MHGNSTRGKSTTLPAADQQHSTSLEFCRRDAPDAGAKHGRSHRAARVGSGCIHRLDRFGHFKKRVTQNSPHARKRAGDADNQDGHQQHPFECAQSGSLTREPGHLLLQPLHGRLLYGVRKSNVRKLVRRRSCRWRAVECLVPSRPLGTGRFPPELPGWRQPPAN